MHKNLGGHMTMATPLFKNFVTGHVQTVAGNMQVKFEVSTFELYPPVFTPFTWLLADIIN